MTFDAFGRLLDGRFETLPARRAAEGHAMKILVVGSGGREHALGWKLAHSPLCKALYFAPGNAGTTAVGTNIAVKADDVGALVAFASREAIDLVVIGPEKPLVDGLADKLRAVGIPTVGPSAAAAQLEGSKAFAKSIMVAAGVPTAKAATFTELAAALAYIDGRAEESSVVKADGLAAGKGVFVCATKAEARAALTDILDHNAFGSAGAVVVIEDFLEGEEASFIALCHDEHVLPLASSQDHKRVGDGDTGPNTGGMGAYSPAPVLTKALEAEVVETVMKPVLKAMKARGTPFTGILYAGLMVTANGPMVLEFNCRMGDPETQPLMARLKSDLVEVFHELATGRLTRTELDWDPRVAVNIVIASAGYPDTPKLGFPITGFKAAAATGALVFHAGTALKGGAIVNTGGRCLGVTALGDGFAEAIAHAYAGAEKLHFEGSFYRHDIGHRALGR
jgi:phosphoribosylamine---glycine ligase